MSSTNKKNIKASTNNKSMEDLDIENASIKKKYNFMKKDKEKYQQAFWTSFNFILATKNEDLIYDYLVSVNANIIVSYYVRISDYTNKQGKTHKAYISEYGKYVGKVDKKSTAPIGSYYDDFEDNYENLKFNQETGDFEIINDTFETRQSNYIKVVNKKVSFSINLNN
jgi:hypothetical protein